MWDRIDGPQHVLSEPGWEYVWRLRSGGERHLQRRRHLRRGVQLSQRLHHLRGDPAVERTRRPADGLPGVLPTRHHLRPGRGLLSPVRRLSIRPANSACICGLCQVPLSWRGWSGWERRLALRPGASWMGIGSLSCPSRSGAQLSHMNDPGQETLKRCDQPNALPRPIGMNSGQGSS